MIRYISFGSVLTLLLNLLSRFAAILVYAQFLSLALCDVIYVWSLMVNIILKIRHITDYRVFYTEKTKKN